MTPGMDGPGAFDPLDAVEGLAAAAGQPVERFLADVAAAHARRGTGTTPSGDTLYQRLEHAGGLRRIAHGLYVRVLADPQLVAYFKHLTERDLRWLHWHLLTFLAVVTGGPNRYAGRDLRQAHSDLDITGEAFDRLCQHLLAAMADLEVTPADRGAVLAKVRAFRPEIITFE
jgi:hemoglobin